MKLSLDLHGVISDIPDTIRFLARAVIQAGGEVHVLTGTTLEKAETELQELNFTEYTHLLSIPDYHTQKGSKILGIHPVFKNNEFSDEDWDRTKGDYCREHEIDLHIDDSIIYKDHFTTPFARLWTLTNTPKLNKPERHLE